MKKVLKNGDEIEDKNCRGICMQ